MSTRTLDVPDLSEAKLKGSSFHYELCGVAWKSRKGGRILLKVKMMSCSIERKEIIMRLMGIKLNVGREK